MPIENVDSPETLYHWSPKPNEKHYLVTYLLSSKMLLNKIGPYLFKFGVETKGKQTISPVVHYLFKPNILILKYKFNSTELNTNHS